MHHQEPAWSACAQGASTRRAVGAHRPSPRSTGSYIIYVVFFFTYSNRPVRRLRPNWPQLTRLRVFCDHKGPPKGDLGLVCALSKNPCPLLSGGEAYGPFSTADSQRSQGWLQTKAKKEDRRKTGHHNFSCVRRCFEPHVDSRGAGAPAFVALLHLLRQTQRPSGCR